jgi:hypothetical protein
MEPINPFKLYAKNMGFLRLDGLLRITAKREAVAKSVLGAKQK